MGNIYSDIFLLLFVCLLGSAGLSAVVNVLLLRFSANLGVTDHSGSGVKRWVSQTKPAVGGISFFVVFLIGISLYTVFQFQQAAYISPQLLGLLSACTIGFLLGLADDNFQLSALVKFVGQLACANILYFSGFGIEIIGIAEFNYIFTIVWIVAIMNSVNMLDNMDGITGTVSTAILLVCTFICGGLYGWTSFYTLIQIGIVGGLSGFLFFNWNPARVYMGDSGSQFLGVFISAISILFLWIHRDPTLPNAFQLRQFALPLVVFTIPIIDTSTVFIRRIARGQSPFVGGRDHTTHHLAFLGLKDHQVALVFLLISAFSIALATYFSFQIDSWIPAYSIIAFAFFFILFCAIQYVYYINGSRKRRSSKVVEADFKPSMKVIKDQ